MQVIDFRDRFLKEQRAYFERLQGQRAQDVFLYLITLVPYVILLFNAFIVVVVVIIIIVFLICTKIFNAFNSKDLRPDARAGPGLSLPDATSESLTAVPILRHRRRGGSTEP